jgi:hypothetical protein
MTQLGEGDAAPGLLDDRSPDDGLDPPDVLADGGLGEVQNGRGAVKSTTVGDGDHAPQRRDVQDLTHAAKVLRSAATIKEQPFRPPVLAIRRPIDQYRRSNAISDIRWTLPAAVRTMGP